MSSQYMCSRRSATRQGTSKRFGSPPGIVPSRRIPPPPPPPALIQPSNATVNPLKYPVQWTPLNTRPKTSGGGGPPEGSGGGGTGSAADQSSTPGNAHPRGGGAGSNGSGGGRQDPLAVIQAVAVPLQFHHHHLQVLHLHSRQEHQVEQLTHGRL